MDGAESSAIRNYKEAVKSLLQSVEAAREFLDRFGETETSNLLRRVLGDDAFSVREAESALFVFVNKAANERTS